MLEFGDRKQIGAVHLSTSLVADLQLVAAACVWAYPVYDSGGQAVAAMLDHRPQRSARGSLRPADPS